MENDTSRLITIPNILTLFRLVLVPVFVITYYENPDCRYISLGIFALASITDCIDGFLARRLKQVTSFGKLCDPLADKFMVVSMMFCLRDVGLLAPGNLDWLNAVILYAIFTKELFMLAGSSYMLKKGHVVHSNIFGKLATMLLCAAIIMIFPGQGVEPWHGLDALQTAGRWTMVVGVCVSFTALIVYIKESLRTLKNKN